MNSRPLSSRITEFCFWTLMAGVAIILALLLVAQPCNAGVLSECETDAECEAALQESLQIIDQRTIPEALKWYCNEYPERYLGDGPMARTIHGDAIEIESCSQVIIPDEIYGVV